MCFLGRFSGSREGGHDHGGGCLASQLQGAKWQRIQMADYGGVCLLGGIFEAVGFNWCKSQGLIQSKRPVARVTGKTEDEVGEREREKKIAVARVPFILPVAVAKCTNMFASFPCNTQSAVKPQNNMLTVCLWSSRAASVRTGVQRHSLSNIPAVGRTA